MGDAVALPGVRTQHVVGREAERARIDAFTAALGEGSTALSIRGESGIGKTTLWRYAVERCRRAGFTVLVTRPAEEEMPLALGGLVDLFERVPVDKAALGADDDPLVRGRAVLDAIRRLAGERPTVVGIDDVQWLDSASARALRYAIRRLESEPIGLLTAVRHGTGGEDRLGANSSLPPGRSETVDLGPLSRSALKRVLREEVETISGPTMRRIHEVSGGNPLYAIELARSLSADDRRSHAGARLPLPQSLQAAIAQRLARMPAEHVPLLETVSALGSTSVKELRATLGDANVDHLLPGAVQHGFLVVDERLGVRFSHPLVGSAVYGWISPLARREMHVRLAETAADPDVRARHLALSTDGENAQIAELLEEAADRAGRRGASDLAAEFIGHSRRLTPEADVDAARRRALGEVEHLAAAGEVSRALSLADELLARLPPGPGRAEALVQLAQLEDDDLQRSEGMLLRALEDAREDVLLRGRVLDRLGWLRGVFLGDLRSGIGCAYEAVAIADQAGDQGLQMLAGAGLAFMEGFAGRPKPERMRKAVALEEAIGRPVLWAGPRALLGKQRLWSGDLDRATELLEAALADAVSSRNERLRSYRLYDLALVNCAAGNLQTADELAKQGLESAQDAEDRHVEGWLLYPVALVHAWLGRAREARAAGGRRLEWALRRGERPGIARAHSVLGLLALSEGDSETAVRELSVAARLLDEMGVGHPGAIPALPDAVEALAIAGETAAARPLVERLLRQGAAVDSPWASAAAERCRGVILLAEGDPQSAIAPLEASTAAFDRLGYRPDAARAMLGLGRALLRCGYRSRAADAIADARGRFTDLGAPLWEARAVEELERVAPGRAVGALTPTERRIAGLVADGRKNREIGQELFMSLATVEAHLTRIYRKLDIRSRSELARLVADGSVVPLTDDR
jgi:DNA-binding CsgD family transcriptional regulator/tetratricopeptide (TPR) repeat protein